jgi:hypothetical protein
MGPGPGTTRFGLAATAGTGGWGYGILGRLEVGVAEIEEGFRQGFGLGIDALATFEVDSAQAPWTVTPGIAAVATWRTLFGPVEPILRAGAVANLAVLLGDGGSWQLDTWLRALLGIGLTVHLDGFHPFLTLDAAFGAGESFALTIGVMLQ